MKNSKLVLLITFLVSINIVCCNKESENPQIKLSTQIETIETKTIAVEDTFIRFLNPDSVYYDLPYLKAGIDGSNKFKAYLQFSLSEEPEMWNKAEVSLYIKLEGEPLYLNVCLVEADWEESTLTWNNHPNNGPLIEVLKITSSDIYRIDVSEFLLKRGEVSICIYPFNETGDYIQIASKENYYFGTEKDPQLIWICEKERGYHIQSPRNSEAFGLGINEIRWDSYSTSDRVEIKLYQGDASIKTLAANTENDGIFEWSISAFDKYSGDQYRIRITDVNRRDIYEYSDYFIISVSNDEMGENLIALILIGTIIVVGIGLIIHFLKRK